MKKNLFALLRTFVYASFVPVLALGLVACEPENGGGSGNGGDDPEETTSEIAVTGLVDALGCTYADISGYANLNLLPVGSGNPVIGVEVVEAKAANNEDAVQSTAGSLVGNIFTVSFSGLTPSTEYKYRSFVTYGGITYYGTKYKTFTTKAVVGVTSTGEVSEVKRTSAILSASVQTEGLDARESINVGFAWSTSKAALCADGSYESTETSVRNVTDGVYSASLSGLSEGTTYYYASFTELGGVYVFSSVKDFETEVFVHKAAESIDLGLSVKWASYNVGAESPEEYGGYYAWGETEEKSDYSWSTYKWCNGSYDTQIKYCTDSYYGTVDNKTILEPEDDAATVNWGGNWRMPTLSEMEELMNECDWVWTSVNGVNGYLVTGSTGNSIFLPAAGCRYGTDVSYRGSLGYYWSATLYDYNSRDACYLFFNDGGCVWGRDYRSNGRPVRPVTE